MNVIDDDAIYKGVAIYDQNGQPERSTQFNRTMGTRFNYSELYVCRYVPAQ